MRAHGFDKGPLAPPSAPVGVEFNRCTDDGSLVSKQGYRLAYGGVPGCWRVKQEDFPAEALGAEGVHCDSCNGSGVVVNYVDPYERGDVSSPEQSPCPDCEHFAMDAHMTEETDLLPLPEWRGDFMTESEFREEAQAYARACVSSATEALRAEVEALNRHCTLLSNIAYNLAQDDRLSDSGRWSLDDARKKWDTAIHPAAAQEGE